MARYAPLTLFFLCLLQKGCEHTKTKKKELDMTTYEEILKIREERETELREFLSEFGKAQREHKDIDDFFKAIAVMSPPQQETKGDWIPF